MILKEYITSHKLLLILLACSLLCSCSTQRESLPASGAESESATATGSLNENESRETATAAGTLDESESHESESATAESSVVSEPIINMPSDSEMRYELYDENGELYAISNYPIVFCEHTHDDCDTSNEELMALGREKLENAITIVNAIWGAVPLLRLRDGFNNDLLGQYNFSTLEKDNKYEEYMELCSQTFADDVCETRLYYAADFPEDIKNPNNYYDYLIEDLKNGRGKPISKVLAESMEVVDGVTFSTKHGVPGVMLHTLMTKLVGVLSADENRIDYRLCTLYEYDHPEYGVFVCEHTVMRLVKTDDGWKISQIRDFFGNGLANNYEYTLEYCPSFLE